MNPLVDISTLPALAQKALSPDGPAPLRLMAANGVMPGLKPGDIVTVVALLTEWPDPGIAETAQKNLANLPKPILDGALGGGLPTGVVDLLADAYVASEEVLGRLLEMTTISAKTVVRLAERGSEMTCERIATNEARLLQNPAIIEALYLSRSTRMSTADRVLELAVRNGLTLNIPAFREAAAAVQDELIPEPSPEPTPDDVAYVEVETLAAKVDLDVAEEDTHVIDDDGKEHVVDKCRPLWVQLANMTVSQKIRRAVLGTAAERMMLVRDSNRLVASAAIRSPQVQENEVVRISASRSVGEEILRIIASNREWTSSYQVKLNLVMNPRTPFTFASKLVLMLRENDLRAISKSKNVTGAISAAARRHLQRRGTQGQG